MIFLITLYIPLFFKLDKTYSCFIDFSASKDFQSEYPILLFLFIYFMWWVCCKISVCFSRSTVYAFLFTLYSGRLTYLNSTNRTRVSGFLSDLTNGKRQQEIRVYYPGFLTVAKCWTAVHCSGQWERRQRWRGGSLYSPLSPSLFLLFAPSSLFKE